MCENAGGMRFGTLNSKQMRSSLKNVYKDLQTVEEESNHSPKSNQRISFAQGESYLFKSLPPKHQE